MKLGQGYVFTCVCDSIHRGGGIPACIAGGIPVCLAAGFGGGVVSQHALQVSGPTPKGEVQGSGQGVSRPIPREVPAPEGVWRPPCDGYCCGWYAFYWNAFLLLIFWVFWCIRAKMFWHVSLKATWIKNSAEVKWIIITRKRQYIIVQSGCDIS